MSSKHYLILDSELLFEVSLLFQEIIEFPILKLNGRTMEIESTFHMYVQPVIHPQLTPFCTEVRALELGSKGHWGRSFWIIGIQGKLVLSVVKAGARWTQLLALYNLLLYLGHSGHWRPRESSGTICRSFPNIFPSL